MKGCSCMKLMQLCQDDVDQLGCTCRDYKNTETEKPEIELDSDSETNDSDKVEENIEREVITGLECTSMPN